MLDRSSLLCLVGLVGCGVTGPSLANQARKSGFSDPIACGANSPIVKVYRTFDFNLDGVANAEGITLLGLSIGAEYYKLEVIDSKIRATSVDGKVVTGTALTGAKIWLELPTTEKVAITISEVGVYPEAVGLRLPLETYVLQWADVLTYVSGPMIPGEKFPDGVMPTEDAPHYVCEEVKEDAEELGLRVFESTVFEGDRYDPDAKTVEHQVDDRWFNIGCGKHMLAKMRLTRNTMHTAKSWQNVQAAMKMFSADYCGTGQPFTLPGVKITWRDRGLMDYSHRPDEIEARWSENGALCLDEPRLVDRADVLAACPPRPGAPKGPSTTQQGVLPTCATADPKAWQWSDELVTSAHY